MLPLYSKPWNAVYRAGLAGWRLIFLTSGLEIRPYRRLADLHMQILDLAFAPVPWRPGRAVRARPRHLLL
jgi:hypothetical protein